MMIPVCEDHIDKAWRSCSFCGSNGKEVKVKYIISYYEEDDFYL